MAQLPILIFPKPKQVSPKTKNGFPPSQPHFPDRDTQISRLAPQLGRLQDQFATDRAILASTISGIDLEMVLVIETAGRIDNLQAAIANTTGLEWLAEWDDEFAPDGDFYNSDTKGLKTDKAVGGRVFLSMSNQQGLNELLKLWKHWQDNQKLPNGKGKWTEVFNQIKDIRRWGIQEQLIETGLLEIWEEDLKYEYTADESINFQIEFFYRRDRNRRKQNEKIITGLIEQLSGSLISPFIDYNEIGFHAVKASLPRKSIQLIVEKIHRNELDVGLLKLPNIMFLRPTGQALTSSPDETQAIESAPETSVMGDPVVAILDGVPFSQHEWLKNRLLLDDPDELDGKYQPGDRKHGTAMASLVIHGEWDVHEAPLTRPVYFRPILQPDPHTKNKKEHVPDEEFYEDRIERAVRRMFEGEGDVPAQAATVKIINLSFGDPNRLFIHSLSPCAKLLDWLSWKYKVLFCVSTGNFSENIGLGFTEDEFKTLTDRVKVEATLQTISDTAHSRRLISPAESINSITVGARHEDASIITNMARSVDILPVAQLPSPINRVGNGFRRSIKPEILMAGGRQLFDSFLINKAFRICIGGLPPGQKVASESKEGERSASTYTCGTSNAAALATRAAAKIYEVVETIRNENPGIIQNEQVSILIKALLVHGASRETADRLLEKHLRTKANSRQFKQFSSKFIGYGYPNIEKVLACTEQRATVIGCGFIKEKQVHEYRFPLPHSLANSPEWRRLTITLAWFSPVNPNHRYLRKAKLFFEPPKKSGELQLERQQSDHNQVQRGTVQHEILESQKVSDYQEGDELVIPVQCNADATDRLDEEIPYALCVTLEVKEGVNIAIYQEIKNHIQLQVQAKQKI
ncbi:MAG: S8 family peptidase [Mucilaginibacter sp.]